MVHTCSGRLAQGGGWGRLGSNLQERALRVVLIEILILAVIAVVVASRFTSFKLPTDKRDAATRKAEMEKLFGRRNGTRPRSHAREAYAAEPAPAEEMEEDAPTAPQKSGRKAAPTARDVAHLAGLEQIKALDANFDLPSFMEGATAAYSYYYECYNGRDREGIINLCGPELEQNIIAEWAQAPAAVVVDGEPEPTFKHARLHGRTALIELAFKATHRTGKTAPKVVRSVWVFARAINSTDPNWEVQSIIPAADA
jgi:predicted lipid-binding transport protein (Tim44 family)